MTSSPAPDKVLLDTCAVIWLAEKQLSQAVASAIVHAALHGSTFVSTVSAWEVCLLSRKQSRSGAILQFFPDPKTWFSRVLSAPGITLAELTPDLAIDACFLPGDLHGDPFDRALIATARSLSATLVTRDRNILAYGAAGFVKTLAC